MTFRAGRSDLLATRDSVGHSFHMVEEGRVERSRDGSDEGKGQGWSFCRGEAEDVTSLTFGHHSYLEQPVLYPR